MTNKKNRISKGRFINIEKTMNKLITLQKKSQDKCLAFKWCNPHLHQIT